MRPCFTRIDTSSLPHLPVAETADQHAEGVEAAQSTAEHTGQGEPAEPQATAQQRVFRA